MTGNDNSNNNTSINDAVLLDFRMFLGFENSTGCYCLLSISERWSAERSADRSVVMCQHFRYEHNTCRFNNASVINYVVLDERTHGTHAYVALFNIGIAHRPTTLPIEFHRQPDKEECCTIFKPTIPHPPICQHTCLSMYSAPLHTPCSSIGSQLVEMSAVSVKWPSVYSVRE